MADKLGAAAVQKIVAAVSGQDIGSLVYSLGQQGALSAIAGTGVIPVVPLNTATTPIYVSGSITNTPAGIVMKCSGKAGTAITPGTGILLYTTTGGKTLYISSIGINFNIATAVSFDIKDSTTAAGSAVIAGAIGASTGGDQTWNQSYPNPAKFANGLFLDTTAGPTACTWNFVGWEA
jgi:hypothetical protein